MKLWLDRVCRIIDGLAAAMLAVLVVLVFGNVALRYLFNSGITFSEEASRWLFVWLTFLGAAVALHEHEHLGTDMLIGRLSRRGKRICLGLAQVLMLYVTWLLFRGSLEQTRINWDVEAPVTGLSMGLFYGIGVVFAVMSGLVLVLQFIRTLQGRLSDDDLVPVQESEDLHQLADLHLDDSTRALRPPRT